MVAYNRQYIWIKVEENCNIFCKMKETEIIIYKSFYNEKVRCKGVSKKYKNVINSFDKSGLIIMYRCTYAWKQ